MPPTSSLPVEPVAGGLVRGTWDALAMRKRGDPVITYAWTDASAQPGSLAPSWYNFKGADQNKKVGDLSGAASRLGAPPPLLGATAQGAVAPVFLGVSGRILAALAASSARPANC